PVYILDTPFMVDMEPVRVIFLVLVPRYRKLECRPYLIDTGPGVFQGFGKMMDHRFDQTFYFLFPVMSGDGYPYARILYRNRREYSQIDKESLFHQSVDKIISGYWHAGTNIENRGAIFFD